MELQIRQAGDADVEALAPHYAAFLDEALAGDAGITRNPDLRPGSAVAALVRKERAAVLVAEVGGELAGFACVEVRPSNVRPRGLANRLREFLMPRRALLAAIFPDRGWLGHLYVLSAHRRRGVARALVQAAADWARARGAKSLELNVLSTNLPARRLYEKLGMIVTLVDYRLDLKSDAERP